MDVINKTRKPLRLSLPGGRILFLGPGKTGQVSPKALAHPMLVKLLETGDIETDAGDPNVRGMGAAMPGRRRIPAISGTSAKRYSSGDR